MPSLERIAVVGASLAGLRAVSALRRGGFDGTITFIGAERHYPYDRPPLSKQILLGSWQPERALLQRMDEYDELQLDVRLGNAAAALDPVARTVRLADGESVPFDAAIIATGASARHLPNTPPLSGIHTLRTIEDCLAIRAAFEAGARVAVVGAGFIGCEVAACARQRGLEVTVVEIFSQPLERALGPVIGATARSIHEGHGVVFRFNSTVSGFEGSERVEAVRLADGSLIPADVVVVGIGIVPETRWLEGSGILVRDGVLCDEYLETNVEGIYAAGDVCRWRSPLFGEEIRVEHWTSAVEQGMTAARNILAPRESRRAYGNVPYVWSDQYDLSIQYIGHGAADDEVVVKHGSLESGKFVALYGRGERLTAAVGFNMARELNDYRRLIATGASLGDAMAHVVETD